MHVTRSLEFTLFADFFPHGYQAMFSLHINDVPPSQNASLYLCSKPVSGVLFWVVFPEDHCIFSFVFSLSRSFSVYSRSHKAVRISDSPVWEIASDNLLYLLGKTVKTHSELKLAFDFLMCSIARKRIHKCIFAALMCVLHLVSFNRSQKLLQSLYSKTY